MKHVEAQLGEVMLIREGEVKSPRRLLRWRRRWLVLFRDRDNQRAALCAYHQPRESWGSTSPEPALRILLDDAECMRQGLHVFCVRYRGTDYLFSCSDAASWVRDIAQSIQEARSAPTDLRLARPQAGVALDASDPAGVMPSVPSETRPQAGVALDASDPPGVMPSVPSEEYGAAEDSIWSLRKWLGSLDLHAHLARALSPSLVPESGDVAYRTMSKSVSYEALAARLRHAKLEGLLEPLWGAVRRLREQEAATGAQLASKFAALDGTHSMAFGTLSHFFAGLEGLIGAPALFDGSVERAMHHEHDGCEDSYEPFTSSNRVT